MKVSAYFEGECIVVPCGDGTNSIEWLIDEMIERYQRLLTNPIEVDTHGLEARCDGSHGILMKEDTIADVLEDNANLFVIQKIQNERAVLIDSSLSWKDTFTRPSKVLYVDGNSMTTNDIVACGQFAFKLEITQEARDCVQKARDLVDEIIASKKVVYGINTGVGKFARVVIPSEKLKELQINVIRSHALGVGEPLSRERARAMLAVRINVLAKGHSGIALDNLDRMVDIFNSGCISLVPSKGTVGASGDLAPLAHLALGMIGEGRMWGPKTGWLDAATVLRVHGLNPIELGPKEGVAMLNGTQFISSLGSEALERAASICRQADVVAALSLEALKGTTTAFREEIHRVRYHKGQQVVAHRIRSLLHSDTYSSKVSESHRFCDKVQDPYTLRCIPQVHGIAHDTIEFVRGMLSTELNSATDNPLVFADVGETLSGGNFHGEYPAKALDYLAIGIHEIANISERRLERLTNSAYSELPAFLTQHGGLNSGFMMAHVTAAALVSENKVLTHPSSVDTLPTSAGTEDHVSMGGFAARKALEIVEHVEYVVAIELMAACQALEFLRPLKTTEPLEAVHRLVRTVSNFVETDRYMKPDLEAVHKLLYEGKVWQLVEPYMNHHEVNLKEKQTNDQYHLKC